VLQENISHKREHHVLYHIIKVHQKLTHIFSSPRALISVIICHCLSRHTSKPTCKTDKDVGETGTVNSNL